MDLVLPSSLSGSTVSSDVIITFFDTRKQTELLCQDLQAEDFVVQPIADVSPTKWHLAHTTWFFETFLLVPYLSGYHVFHQSYNYLFNSYYENVGKRTLRADRGNLTRPTTKEIFEYRKYIDEHIHQLLHKVDTLDATTQQELHKRLVIGINHEQQHQELLITDIKYVLGHNPLFPKVRMPLGKHSLFNTETTKTGFSTIQEDIYEIGYQGKGFCFDNEKGVHRVFLDAFEIQNSLVSNGEYLEFIEQGGYQHVNYWLSEGWEFVKKEGLQNPLYWHKIDHEWYHYTFNGLEKLPLDAPLCHVSFYEAEAYAQFRNMRLPTEAEWEIAQTQFEWGQRWEWTRSNYVPYPNFEKDDGALGEYNGKFMVNQQVLRGSSEATPTKHSRPTYRNFFHADKRWQFTGIRLVKK